MFPHWRSGRPPSPIDILSVLAPPSLPTRNALHTGSLVRVLVQHQLANVPTKTGDNAAQREVTNSVSIPWLQWIRCALFVAANHRNRFGRVCRCQRQKTVALGSFLIMSAFAVSGLIRVAN